MPSDHLPSLLSQHSSSEPWHCAGLITIPPVVRSFKLHCSLFNDYYDYLIGSFVFMSPIKQQSNENSCILLAAVAPCQSARMILWFCSCRCVLLISSASHHVSKANPSALDILFPTCFRLGSSLEGASLQLFVAAHVPVPTLVSGHGETVWTQWAVWAAQATIKLRNVTIYCHHCHTGCRLSQCLHRSAHSMVSNGC